MYFGGLENYLSLKTVYFQGQTVTLVEGKQHYQKGD